MEVLDSCLYCIMYVTNNNILIILYNYYTVVLVDIQFNTGMVILHVVMY